MNDSSKFSNTRHAVRVLSSGIACSMLLVLSSCGIPNFRLAEPAPGIPETYNGTASQENSAQLKIDEFFNDPLLLRLIDQALVTNRELKILDEEVQIARNQILARQGAYLPFIGLRGSGGLDELSRFTPLGAAERDLQYLPGRNFNDPLPNILGTLDVFWQLDIWRELRNARDAAIQRYAATIERRNFFVTRLIAEIAENYYGLMALDKRLENLDQVIKLQEDSLKLAKLRFVNGRGTDLAVQRFLAEVRKNQSEKLIVRQDIIEVENRINFRANRYPQPVERTSANFFNLTIHPLALGVPAQLLLFRPDIRQAERELEAAGLDVKVMRAHFFPRVDITGGVGYQSFNPRYLFWTPEAMVASVAGDMVVPLVNKKAIQADFRTANAKQLQSIYSYQRVILDAFTQVINRVSLVENYGRSIEIKKQQLEALTASVLDASRLFDNGRVEYMDVLFAQRDLRDARTVLIDTKRQQLSAIVNTYQALGGGGYTLPIPTPEPPQFGPRNAWSHWWSPFASPKTVHP